MNRRPKKREFLAKSELEDFRFHETYRGVCSSFRCNWYNGKHLTFRAVHIPGCFFTLSPIKRWSKHQIRKMARKAIRAFSANKSRIRHNLIVVPHFKETCRQRGSRSWMGVHPDLTLYPKFFGLVVSFRLVVR